MRNFIGRLTEIGMLIKAFYLAGARQGAVGRVGGSLFVRQPPAAEAVHGVRGDGVAQLLEGVVTVAALFDLV